MRFRQTRVLIVGCGDIGLRVARALPARVRRLALTPDPQRVPLLRAAGLTPLVGDLDQPDTLRRLSSLAGRVLHLAPPPRTGAHSKTGSAWASRDPRTLALVHALRLRTPPQALVYGSTSGVYGDCSDCGGARVSEARPIHPQTARARRRADAERTVRWLGRTSRVRTTVLRISGIYAPGRPGGTPRERLRNATPVLRAEDDIHTSHIHADDLARACIAALWRGRPQRIINVCDDTALKMGDYFDLAADLYALPRPPRLSRQAIQSQLSPLQRSFTNESRLLDNTRLKRELRVPLIWPTVEQGLTGCPRTPAPTKAPIS
jgi:nucleoside-diphosphate-sugar epimerase